MTIILHQLRHHFPAIGWGNQRLFYAKQDKSIYGGLSAKAEMAATFAEVAWATNDRIQVIGIGGCLIDGVVERHAPNNKLVLTASYYWPMRLVVSLASTTVVAIAGVALSFCFPAWKTAVLTATLATSLFFGIPGVRACKECMGWKAIEEKMKARTRVILPDYIARVRKDLFFGVYGKGKTVLDHEDELLYSNHYVSEKERKMLFKESYLVSLRERGVGQTYRPGQLEEAAAKFAEEKEAKNLQRIGHRKQQLENKYPFVEVDTVGDILPRDYFLDPTTSLLTPKKTS